MEIRLKFDAALWVVCLLCAAIVVTALVMAYPSLLCYLPRDSSALATWVQAIGSILAIYYAGKFGRQQIEFTRTLEIERHLKRLDVYSVAFNSAAKFCLDAIEHCSSPDNASGYFDYKYSEEHFRLLQKGLDEIQSIDMGSAAGVEALAEMKDCLVRSKGCVHAISTYDEYAWGSTDKEGLAEYLDLLRMKTERSLNQFKSLQQGAV